MPASPGGNQNVGFGRGRSQRFRKDKIWFMVGVLDQEQLRISNHDRVDSFRNLDGGDEVGKKFQRRHLPFSRRASPNLRDPRLLSVPRQV